MKNSGLNALTAATLMLLMSASSAATDADKQSLEVLVLNEQTGEPIPNLRIEFLCKGGGETIYSNKAGKATLVGNGRQGRLLCRLSRDHDLRYPGHYLPVTPEDWQRGHITWKLPIDDYSRKITACVINEETSEALPGVHVIVGVAGSSVTSALTDAEGRVSHEYPGDPESKGTWLSVFFYEGVYLKKAERIRLTEQDWENGQEIKIAIVPPKLSLEIDVTLHSQGKEIPVPDQTVIQLNDLTGVEGEVAASNGKALFYDVDPGEYHLRPFPGRYVSKYTPVEYSGEGTVKLKLAMVPAEEFRENVLVAVVDSTGKPVSGAKMKCVSKKDAAISSTKTTDNSGKVVFDDLAVGHYALSYAHDDYVISGMSGISLPGPAEWTATAYRAYSVTIQAPGRPINEAIGMLSLFDAGRFTQENPQWRKDFKPAAIHPDGKIVFEKVPAGRYLVMVVYDDLQRSMAIINVPEQTGDVFRMPDQGKLLRMNVTYKKDNPDEHRTIVFVSQKAPDLATTYAIEQLPMPLREGRYRVFVHLKDGLADAGEVDVREGQPLHLDLTKAALGKERIKMEDVLRQLIFPKVRNIMPGAKPLALARP